MQLEDILRKYHFDISLLNIPEYSHEGEKRPIYLLRVAVDQAFSQWEVLRSIIPETGYWPIIGWDRFKTLSINEETVQNIVDTGLRENVQRWFEKEWHNLGMSNGEETSDTEERSSSFTFLIHLGQFPFTPAPFVPIALIPTTRCWEIPAYLPITLNKWDPPPAIHVAILKYWYEQWKAELVAAVPGVMELRVLYPPTTWQASLTLAREQYAYCPDIVDQGVRSINVLTRTLLSNHIWRFWWD